ncbi:MAG: excinuclease ABC subunit UvrA [Candidatus Magasanikbacteria bacterium]|nr:excinuclease ABC subunit UvrA [Candidatus Magasanikbacteria bacterium]
MSDKIIIKGARVHNLKNINVDIPKNKFVVVTGLSGSGKSSLAFDTIYAEGQRRYAESLSSFARQFMEVRDKPDVDSIEGLSPTIAIDQRVSTQNPRSTVGTITEIYDYLRLLFARTGEQFCPDCGEKVDVYTAGEISEKVRQHARKGGVFIMSPLVRNQTVDPKVIIEEVEQSGLDTVWIDGEFIKINDLVNYDFKSKTKYNISLLVAKIDDIKKQDPMKPVETAIDLSNGLVDLLYNGKPETLSTFGLCPSCGKMMPAPDIRNFSFNSPLGACPRCTGLGITMEVDPDLVIPNPRLTLAEGAIQPWTRITGNQSWYQKMLGAVAGRSGFSLDTPISGMPKSVIDIILKGTGNEIYEVEGKKISFVGVMEDLRARHLATDSEYVRKEIEQYMREQICSLCHGKRLKAESLAVKIKGFNIAETAALNIEESILFFKGLNGNSGKKDARSAVVTPVVREIVSRLENLSRVGLDYLSIDRAMNTLSGGEVTRVRLSTQLSSGLTGVVYILDEPSVGLHQRDIKKLIDTLKFLRDLGNTVIVVEHDASVMNAADYLIDVGPGAGVYGGEIMAKGTLAEIKKAKNSLTGDYLAGRIKITRNLARQKTDKIGKKIRIVGASAFNLKNITVDIPLGKLLCVTGVSGSGKSTLIVEILSKALSKHFFRSKEEPGAHKAIEGLNNIDKVIAIDQTPIGRTPRSNPATYTGAFTLIRDLFAALPEAKMRRFDAGKFSFNVKGGGRCEACAGEGYVRIPMQFLADVFVTCNECNGSRYNQEAMEIHCRGKNIADVLNMTVEEAFKFFVSEKQIAQKLNVLRDVGLGYLRLGQPATTLSGGEAQRIKLATELSRASTGATLYILDEPTTGLHFEDTSRLLQVLEQLVDKGNTVLIIEHNIDVIKNCDWIIELGPDGGKRGGELVAAGPLEKIMKTKNSWTAKYLK